MTSYLVTIETDRARDKRTAPKKTSGADVLSSRKKNSEKPCTSEGCPSPPPPPPSALYVRGLKPSESLEFQSI